MRELEETLDAEELTEWAAYAILDPFGGLRGDFQAALIASNIMNATAGKVVVHAKDLMPKFGPPRLAPRMSGREIRARLELMRVGKADHA